MYTRSFHSQNLRCGTSSPTSMATASLPPPQTHSAARSRNPLTSEEGNCNHVARQSSRRDVRVHSGESSASTVATVEQPGISATRRRIILMRHAESEGAGNTVRDHDRPITAFGRHTAQQVARQLTEAAWAPDLIMCSDSTRTRQTLEAMQAASPALRNATVCFRGDLYTASALDDQTRGRLTGHILGKTKRQPTSTVLCLGHNRGWEETASSFAGKKVKLRPCYAALLEDHASSWTEALDSTKLWHLVGTLVPQLASTDESDRQQQEQQQRRGRQQSSVDPATA